MLHAQSQKSTTDSVENTPFMSDNRIIPHLDKDTPELDKIITITESNFNLRDNPFYAHPKVFTQDFHSKLQALEKDLSSGGIPLDSVKTLIDADIQSISPQDYYTKLLSGYNHYLQNPPTKDDISYLKDMFESIRQKFSKGEYKLSNEPIDLKEIYTKELQDTYSKADSMLQNTNTDELIHKLITNDKELDSVLYKGRVALQKLLNNDEKAYFESDFVKKLETLDKEAVQTLATSDKYLKQRKDILDILRYTEIKDKLDSLKTLSKEQREKFFKEHSQRKHL